MAEASTSNRARSQDGYFGAGEKWDERGACRVVAASQVAPIETVGLFCVPKDAEWDRLKLNPTVINSRCYGYSSYTKTLAPGYLIASIQLHPDENLLISSDDLCEFYYTFKVSARRAQRNAIGLVFHGSELQHLKWFDPALRDSQCYICLGTLAMGDALAVEIAQQSHFNLLRTLAGSMKGDEVLQYRLPCPRGPFYELLTIDDHIGLQRVKRGQPPEELCQTRAHEVFAASERAYKEVQLTAHPGKRQRQVEHATVLEAEVLGSKSSHSSFVFHHKCHYKEGHHYSQTVTGAHRLLDPCLLVQEACICNF